MIKRLFVVAIITAIQTMAAAGRPVPEYAIIDTSTNTLILNAGTTEVDTIRCAGLSDLPTCKAKLRIDPDIIMIYQPIEGEDGNILYLSDNSISSYCVDNLPVWIVANY